LECTRHETIHEEHVRHRRRRPPRARRVDAVGVVVVVVGGGGGVVINNIIFIHRDANSCRSSRSDTNNGEKNGEWRKALGVFFQS
jgi:hypothetical protein